MKISLIAATCATVLVVAGCSPVSSDGFFAGDLDACDGVIVNVNFGILSDDAIAECVEFDSQTALAKDVLAFAGVDTEGTDAYGDMVVCRVNSLPSPTEEIVIEGEDPYLETCLEMPPAFAFWALWHKDGDSAWDYASEGVGTLMVAPGESLGLGFSSGTEIVTPDIEP